MFLWWGPDLIQFYNDGYRPSIRADKHPSAVGQRGMECWPEIWPIIGPQIAAVMGRGESTWNTNQLVPINRNGKLEEVYWTYSYSPVRDKEGAVRGTLVVCSETTEQVLSERRLRTLLGITAGAEALNERAENQPLARFAGNGEKSEQRSSRHSFCRAVSFQRRPTCPRRKHSSDGEICRYQASGRWANAMDAQGPSLVEDLQCALRRNDTGTLAGAGDTRLRLASAACGIIHSGRAGIWD